MRTVLLILVLMAGCVAAPKVDLEAKTRFDAEMKALSDIQADILTDITATNEMVANVEADVAGIVKRQAQQVADGGAGNEGGVGIGSYGRYYGGAGLLALMWGLERLGYWLRRWQKSRNAAER